MTGEEFKAARNRLGLSQTVLAHHWGIDPKTIYNWEHGTPPDLAADAIRYVELSRAINQVLMNQEEQL